MGSLTSKVSFPIPAPSSNASTQTALCSVSEEHVDSLQKRLLAIEGEKKESEERLADCARRYQMLKERMKEMDKDAEQRDSLIDAKAKETQHIMQNFNHLQCQHEKTVSTLNDCRKLLESRTAELNVAKTFLTLTDEFTGADLVAMVQELNNEAMQNASFMADSFVFGMSKFGSEEAEGAARRAAEVIGSTLVDSLRKVKHDDVGTFVEIALQACVVTYVRHLSMAWSLYGHQNDLFRALYAGMQENEGHGVGERWRALTQKYLHDPHAATYTTSYISKAFSDILVVAGCQADLAEIEKTLERFKGRTNRIVELGLRLKRAIGEGVTSADFEIFASAGVFNPEYMEDAYDGGKGAGGQVLCTTGLGLCRRERLKQKNGVEQSVILKAKVVTESSLG